MGFNLGAALGAAAETGVNTYTKLQRQAAEDLVAKKLLKELKEDEMLAAETQRQTALGTPKGGVAAPAFFDKAINYGEGHEAIRNHVAALPIESQNEFYSKVKGTEVDVSKEAGIDLGKVRAYKGENGPMATTEFTPRSHTEAMGAAAEALAGQGYFNAAKKAGDLYQSARQLDYTKGWDKITKQANDWRQTFDSALQKGGVSGALETMDPVLKKLGINARASGDKVEVLGADGKVATTFNGVAELEKGFHGAVSSYVANAALSLTGGDPAKIASMMKDLQSGEYFKFKTDEGKANAGLEREVLKARISSYQSSAANSSAQMNSLGAPIGTDKDGAPIFQSKNGPVYGDKKPVDPKLEITPWNMQKNYNPTLAQMNVTMKGADGKDEIVPVNIVTQMDRNNKVTTTVSRLDGSIVNDPEVIKQLNTRALPKEIAMNDLQKEQYRAFVQEAMGVEDPVKRRQIAQRYPALTPEMTGTAPSAMAQAFANNPPPKDKPAPKQSGVSEELAQLQAAYKAHRANAIPPSKRTGGDNRAWELENDRLLKLLDSYKPGGANYHRAK